MLAQLAGTVFKLHPHRPDLASLHRFCQTNCTPIASPLHLSVKKDRFSMFLEAFNDFRVYLELYKRIESVIRSLQKWPTTIQSFFRYPVTKYTRMFRQSMYGLITITIIKITMPRMFLAASRDQINNRRFFTYSRRLITPSKGRKSNEKSG